MRFRTADGGTPIWVPTRPLFQERPPSPLVAAAGFGPGLGSLLGAAFGSGLVAGSGFGSALGSAGVFCSGSVFGFGSILRGGSGRGFSSGAGSSGLIPLSRLRTSLGLSNVIAISSHPLHGGRRGTLRRFEC
ncbi:hypothetical protein EPJ93_22435 [Mycobacteroides abscessus subsp. abscessus]|nr:hypothetical protein EPJ93_22435 [Mycobacteroides abscessus subsp. abscessus]